MQPQPKNQFYCFEEYKWKLKLKNHPEIKGCFVDFYCESPTGEDTHYPDGDGKDFAFCPTESIIEFVGSRRIHRAVYPEYILLFNQSDVESLQLDAF